MLGEIGDLALLDLRPSPSLGSGDIVIVRVGGGRDGKRKEARQDRGDGGKPWAGMNTGFRSPVAFVPLNLSPTAKL
jgi:hypothetical protein